MRIKTSGITGPALDWAVAKCEGHTPLYENAPHANLRNKLGNIWHLDELNYSTDWPQGGPIIEQEKIGVWWDGVWHAKYDGCRPYQVQDADTPLIAAMRCYVASKLGEEIEIPKELS